MDNRLKQAFMDRLATLPLNWYIDKGLLRARYENGDETCPVAAVANSITGKSYSMLGVGLPWSSRAANITCSFAMKVRRATDGLVGRSLSLRLELLDRTVHKQEFIDRIARGLVSSVETPATLSSR